MLALDHLVIATKDPLKSAEQFAKKYQVKIVQGGKHDIWGTHNVLAYFSNNCYIEWLGIFDEKVAKHSNNPLIQQLVHQLKNNGEGLFQYGLRTKEMDIFIDHFSANNIPYVGPLKGELKRPDGTNLMWRMLFPESSLFITPFLIEWGQPNLYGADPAVVNDQKLTVFINEKENLQLFHHIYQSDEREEKISLQNGHLRLTKDHLLHVTVKD